MKLTFFFDYSSPFAYLGAHGVEKLARDHSADLAWRPFLLGALFKEIGTPIVPLQAMPPAKQQYAYKDMMRWAAYREAPFEFPSRFPMNTVKALRMTLQLDQADVSKLALPIFQAYWAEDRDINDPEELKKIASDAGLDGEALLAGTQDQAIKDQLRDNTNAAVKVGLPGAPGFFVQKDDDDPGMLFWGQDRFELIGKALDGWRPDCG